MTSEPLYLIQVKGNMEASSFRDALEDAGMESADNVIIVDKQVKPLGRDEALFFLEELARTLDVAEEMEIDWESVYEEDWVKKDASE